MVALVIGCLGQITFHLMQAAGMSTAPWPITMLVSCLPVGVLGMGAALYHLFDDAHDQPPGPPQVSPTPAPPAAPTPGTVPRSAPTTPAPTPQPSRRPPFQAIPNLTTVRPAHPTDARPEPPLTGRPEPQPAGRPGARSTDRPDPTPLGRPDPSPSERPADRAAGRPDATARPAPSRRPAGTRRARKRGARARTDEQLADVVHQLAIRNGGVAPSQYQVRQALGVGSGRAARMVAAYQPPTTTSSHGITASESGEGSP